EDAGNADSAPRGSSKGAPQRVAARTRPNPGRLSDREFEFIAGGWSRRESNPGPRGFRFAFVHVRSRADPCDGVRRFGYGLAPCDLDDATRGGLASSSPGGWRLSDTRTISRSDARYVKQRGGLRYRSQFMTTRC